MNAVAHIPCSNVVVKEIPDAKTKEIPANANPKFLALTAGKILFDGRGLPLFFPL